MRNYAEAAQQAVQQETELSTAQKAQLEALSKELETAKNILSTGLELVHKDVKDEKLTAPHAKVERAKLEASYLETETTIIEQMRDISPSYAERAKNALQFASDLAAFETVQAASKAGNAVGAFLAPVVQAVRGVGNGVKKGSNKRITDPRRSRR